jgi:hypothetical protein
MSPRFAKRSLLRRYHVRGTLPASVLLCPIQCMCNIARQRC